MSIDKFKDLRPVNHQFDVTDAEYVDKLNNLPKRRPKKQIWTAVGTVAAAVAIVAAVTLWALIGRGLRGTEPDELLLYPAGEVAVDVTDDMQQKFDMMYSELKLFALPIFKEGEAPSQKAFSDYVYYIQTPAKNDWVITASELNDLYFDTFGQKSEFTSGINYDGPYSVNASLVGQELLSFSRSFLPEETQKITLTYGEPDVSVTTLSYVAKSDFEPEYFIEHTTLNTVILKKSKDNNTAADLYKISGKLADELLDFVRDATDTKDRSVCYCVPTHTIVFNDVEYKVVLGDKLTSHIVYTDARDATTNHKLTEAEFDKLKGLLDQCITDKNFIKTQKISYTPSADKVIVTVSSLTGNYKQGTHTITGDDAKALITALETKSYTGLGGLQGMTAELKINERTYYLYISDDLIHIENSCGGLELAKDDEIVKIVEKYIKNPEDSSVGTIIETEHSTYDESDNESYGTESIYVPKDVYVGEYLPLKLDYVKKQTNNGIAYYFNAKKDFVTREPITEKMIDAAKKYMHPGYFNADDWETYRSTMINPPSLFNIRLENLDFVPGCNTRRGEDNADWFGFPERYPNDLEYFESWFEDDTFVVKGHFEEGYGDSYARYVVDEQIKTGYNYEIEPYTVHNFVIDKVYDENCGYKAGDIVEVGLGGTIMQDYYGYYCAVNGMNRLVNYEEYASFKGKTLEQRTFIISLKPPSVDDRPDIFTVDHLCHNAYDTETVYNFSNAAYGPYTLSAKEILEKYN